MFDLFLMITTDGSSKKLDVIAQIVKAHVIIHGLILTMEKVNI